MEVPSFIHNIHPRNMMYGNTSSNGSQCANSVFSKNNEHTYENNNTPNENRVHPGMDRTSKHNTKSYSGNHKSYSEDLDNSGVKENDFSSCELSGNFPLSQSNQRKSRKDSSIFEPMEQPCVNFEAVQTSQKLEGNKLYSKDKYDLSCYNRGIINDVTKSNSSTSLYHESVIGSDVLSLADNLGRNEEQGNYTNGNTLENSNGPEIIETNSALHNRNLSGPNGGQDECARLLNGLTTFGSFPGSGGKNKKKEVL
jgi:hypothetical protein